MACRFTAALRQDDAAKVGGAYESATDWPKLARRKQNGSTAHESTEPVITGVSQQIGHYADAIRVPAGYEQIITSGTPGLTADGELPDNIADQARQAWQNIEAALAKAGASIPDVVSIRQWLTDADGIKAYTLVRSEFVKHECASMLAVIPALVWPSMKVEIQVVAVRASPAS